MSFLAKQKSMARNIMRTRFQQGWQWLVEFHGTGVNPPADFDMYCKEIEHGGVTIEYEEKQIGANTIMSPTHRTAGEITLMIRDNEDARCEEFFKRLASRVVNDDGTVNLPRDYLFTMQLYRLSDEGQKIPYKKWTCSLEKYGGFTRSRDEVGAFVMYPVTFRKYQAFDKG